MRVTQSFVNNFSTKALIQAPPVRFGNNEKMAPPVSASPSEKKPSFSAKVLVGAAIIFTVSTVTSTVLLRFLTDSSNQTEKDRTTRAIEQCTLPNGTVDQDCLTKQLDIEQ
ncbi:MAG: hypothetical protein U0003_03025 [Vampirovibrionales bacterium]